MIRRFFTRLLLVVLIAACGWNWLQVQQLSAQVTQLQFAQQTLRPSGAAAHRHSYQAQTQAARLGLPRLQDRWKHLQNQASFFRLASKKVFHEII